MAVAVTVDVKVAIAVAVAVSLWKLLWPVAVALADNRALDKRK